MGHFMVICGVFMTIFGVFMVIFGVFLFILWSFYVHFFVTFWLFFVTFWSFLSFLVIFWSMKFRKCFLNKCSNLFLSFYFENEQSSLRAVQKHTYWPDLVDMTPLIKVNLWKVSFRATNRATNRATSRATDWKFWVCSYLETVWVVVGNLKTNKTTSIWKKQYIYINIVI